MKKSFAELISSEKPTLVDFSAEWCGPCKMLKPILEEVKSKFSDDLHIIKIDIDRNPSVASGYQIQSVPTLILFQEGKMLWRQSGVMPTHEIEKIIRAKIR